jgi:hypothetical protein
MEAHSSPLASLSQRLGSAGAGPPRRADNAADGD